MNKAVEQIRKMAKEAADERIADEKKKLEVRVNNDLEVLEQIIAMVKDRLIYKDTKDGIKTRYKVVTEEVVLKDYATPAQYSSGTAIERVESSFYKVPHTRIKVNGHVYYHAKDIFENYKWQARKASENAEKIYEITRAREDAIKELEAIEPVVKELMLNYEKHLDAKNKVTT